MQWEEGWDFHPRDRSSETESEKMKSLYWRAGGVWVALAQLAKANYFTLPQPLYQIYDQILDNYLKGPDT